jgi:hypothetical protein
LLSAIPKDSQTNSSGARGRSQPRLYLAESERLDRKTEATFARLERLRREIAERAAARPAEVATLESPEELAALDRRRAIYPDSPLYAADFWRRVLQELRDPGSPAMQR